MKKEEIIKKIDEAILTEEKAIPIYMKHIESTMYWSELKEKDRINIRNVFVQLKEDSLKHIEFLNRIKEILEKRY